MKKDHWRQPVISSLWFWLLIGWIVAWSSSAVFSIDREAAFGAVKAWLIDPLLFIGLVHLYTGTMLSRLDITKTLIVSGTIVAVYGLFQFVFDFSSLQDGRLSSFFRPVANYAAMYLGLLLLVGIAVVVFRLLSSRWLVPVGVMAIALGLSLSYGGFLAVAVGALGVWWYMPQRTARKILPVVAGALAIVFVGFLSTTENFREHFNRDRSSGLVRTQIWVTSWSLIRQHPIVGIGPNTFEQAYRKEVPKHYFPPLEWLVAQPHNLYLALWLETGLLGLVIFLFSVSLFFQRLINGPLRDPSRHAYALVSAVAVIAILVHGLVDTPVFKNDLAMMLPLLILLPWLSDRRQQLN
jgi:O-antigen ligase